MKQNQLRVGNWVLYESTVDDHEPIQINGSDLAILPTIEDRYCGIPITKEWLEKFGFIDKDDIGVFINGRYDVERLLSDSDEWEFCINEEQTGTTIKYVHQLQNIYYCLTGTELTIKK